MHHFNESSDQVQVGERLLYCLLYAMSDGTDGQIGYYIFARGGTLR